MLIFILNVGRGVERVFLLLVLLLVSVKNSEGVEEEGEK